MITVGAKVYFGLAAFALFAAVVLGLASGGTVLGILSFGWSGPIGDNLGYTVLLGTSAAAFFMGAVTTAFRDADAVPVTQVAGTDTLPAAVPPAGLSPWPVVAAFGVVTLAIGLVIDSFLTGVGILLLAMAAIEWTATAWADRATGDPEANRAIRNRVMQPLEIPAIAIIGIGIFVFFASRMLLSLSKWGAIAVFAATGAIIMGVAALIATRPKVSRGVITAVLLLGGATLVVGGIVGIGAGERDFHHAGEGGENAETHGEDGADESGTDSSTETTDTTAGDTEE